MLEATPVVALIPARSGSKGVANKNMRKVAGRPLIDFTIEAALQSSFIDVVFVSSDHNMILSHAKSMGVTGILRPVELASDSASPVEVVEHFIQLLPKKISSADPYIVYLQPTSPFRTVRHIDDAFLRMLSLNVQSLVSVAEVERLPFKMFRLNEQGYLESLFDERLSNARRQDLPAVFIPNGAIYIFRASKFRERGWFPTNGSTPFIMSQSDSLDIDTESDFQRAEMRFGVL